MRVKFIKYPINDVLPYTPSIIIAAEPALLELSKPLNPDKPNSRFWLRCHNCGMTANLGDHEITINTNGITISPSILCPRQGCGAHYYIKNSEIV